VKNAAGGFVFGIDDAARLRRFLVLGTEGGTYYTKAPELTQSNAEVVMRMAQNDPTTLVDTIVDISVAGRAPRQNPAIFALAIAASLADDAGRAYALSKVSQVCRTGTHLYLFAGYVEQFRGWGRGLKRAVGSWYTSKPLDREAYQLLKYRQREGWMHRDLLRLAHPIPDSDERRNLHDYLMITAQGKQEPTERALRKFGDKARSPYSGRQPEWGAMPRLLSGFEDLQHATVAEACLIIHDYDIAWEMIPDRLLNEGEVWEALIDKGMPITALMRQLPRLTNLKLTTDGTYGSLIAKRLTDREALKRGRVHPINVLVAQRTYASGRSVRGDSTWQPTRQITDALDAAFYLAYDAVEPSGVRGLLACDVSGSMGSPAGGLPITCREVCAALSLVVLNVEKGWDIIGFSDGQSARNYGSWYGGGSAATRLDITPRRRLDDVCNYMAGLNFGRTDCSLPMIWANSEKQDYDALWVLTDNETWFGQIHPWQALKLYREKWGPTQFGVVAMTATGTSIADPNDPGSLDIAGFDTNVPQVIRDFSASLI
jgi:60 kDa SS-A/Ro ribonucleoprotein